MIRLLSAAALAVAVAAAGAGAGVHPATATAPPHELVFASNRAGTFDIWGSAADGSGAHVIVGGPLEEIEPTLSPDGTKLAFVRTLATTCCGPTHDLWVVGTDGRGERAVANDPAVDEYAPEWSPDGTEIAFSRGSQAPPAANIFAVRPDGSGLRQITTGGGISNIPSWSPLGDRLVFTSNRDGKQKLWTVGRDGSSPAPLTDPPAGADLTPRWSPVGDAIAFRSSRSGAFEIWTVAADGSDVRRVTNDAFEDRFPTFTADGSGIVYASVREPCAIATVASARCASQLWRVALDGTGAQQLTTTGHADFPQVRRAAAVAGGPAGAGGGGPVTSPAPAPAPGPQSPSAPPALPATGWSPTLAATGLLLVAAGWCLLAGPGRRVRADC